MVFPHLNFPPNGYSEAILGEIFYQIFLFYKNMLALPRPLCIDRPSLPIEASSGKILMSLKFDQISCQIQQLKNSGCNF